MDLLRLRFVLDRRSPLARPGGRRQQSLTADLAESHGLTPSGRS